MVFNVFLSWVQWLWKSRKPKQTQYEFLKSLVGGGVAISVEDCAELQTRLGKYFRCTVSAEDAIAAAGVALPKLLVAF